MRILTLRLTISLIVGITLISLLSSYYEVRFQKRGLRSDLEHRAEVLGESLAAKVEPYLNLKKGSRKELQLTVDRFATREHLTGVAVYNDQGDSLAITPLLAPRLTSEPAMVQQAAKQGQSAGVFLHLGDAPVYIYALPLHQGEVVVGGLAIVDDASYINVQGRRIWRETFLRVLVLVFLITLTTLLIVRWSITGPIARAAQWMRALRTGKPSSQPAEPDLAMFRPLAHEMANFAASLSRGSLRCRTGGPVASGRGLFLDCRTASRPRARQTGGEPAVRCSQPGALHPRRQGKVVEAIVPASGLVTALEPVLARMRWNLGRARERGRGPRDGGQARSFARSAG